MEPKFTSDWFSHHIPLWELWLRDLKGLPHLDFLEVGCYEGRATIWLLNNIITHDSCKISCIDWFVDEEYTAANNKTLRDQFIENIIPYLDKISVYEDQSFNALQNLNIAKQKFDFIYIDGCHKSQSVIEDGVLGFRLLKQYGIMIFDDYNYMAKDQIHELPRLGISAFLSAYTNLIKIIYVGEQVVIQKIC